MSTPMDQTKARRVARFLTAKTGEVHIAAAVPLGCWGGTESGWDVFGPAVAEFKLAEQALIAWQAAEEATGQPHMPGSVASSVEVHRGIR
jgi:hypothetical protein